MKNNLGKLLLILLSQILLNANQLATYKLSSNKDEAYIKEAIKITFVAVQQDHTDNMYFLLKPKKSSDYNIKLLKKIINDKKYHDSQTSFIYILFPLKAKTISVDFDFTIQTASDKAVAQSFVDDHDNSIATQTYNTKVKIKSLFLNVKKLSQDVDFVGDFTLNSKINKNEITEYNDVSLLYTIQGEGYKNEKLNILHSIANVNIFSDKHDTYSKLLENGYAIKREYVYALSSKHDFFIPAVSLKAYSTKKHKFYSLKAPQYDIKVTKIDISNLLDAKESPKTEKLVNFKNIKIFFIYLLIFISGFVTAKLTNIDFRKRKKEVNFTDIRETNSPKELILVLLNNYKNKKIDNFITKLELLQYHKDVSLNFKEIKESILKEFNRYKNVA